MTPLALHIALIIGKGLRRLTPRRIRRDEEGATTVEFAFIALPFFTLVGAILETSLIFMAGQMMETAILDSSRLIKTGQAQQANYSKATFKEKVCERVHILIDCDQLYVDVKIVNNFGSALAAPPLDEDGNIVDNSEYWPGKGSQIIVVRAFYDFPQIFTKIGVGSGEAAAGRHILGAVTAFRNEPFPW